MNRMVLVLFLLFSMRMFLVGDGAGHGVAWIDVDGWFSAVVEAVVADEHVATQSGSNQQRALSSTRGPASGSFMRLARLVLGSGSWPSPLVSFQHSPCQTSAPFSIVAPESL